MIETWLLCSFFAFILGKNDSVYKIWRKLVATKMRTTYSYSDFKKTYPDIAHEVDIGMYNGVTHFLYLLDKYDVLPIGVVSSVDLVAIEYKPGNTHTSTTLTYTICVYLTNDMFFVDSIDIQCGDITNELVQQFEKNETTPVNYVIEFYEENRQKDIPDIVEDKLKYNASLIPSNERHHVVLAYTKNTQYFHDVYSMSERTIRDYADTLWDIEYDHRYDRD